MEGETKKKEEILFNETLNAFKNIIEGIFIYKYKNISKEFGIDFFDDDINFYSKLLNDMCDASFPVHPIKLLSHELNQRNLIILIKLIQQLSQYRHNLYKDPIIKINLSIIIGYFTNGFGKKFVDTPEYFYLCLKELVKFYGIQNINLMTTFDKIWREKAKESLKTLEDIKKRNILKIFSKVQILYENEKDYDEVAKVGKIIRLFNEDKNQLSMKELEEKYLTNPFNDKYIKLFLENECKEFKNDILYEEKKNELYKNLIFKDVLNLDLKDIEECLFLIFVSKQAEKKATNLDKIYYEYKQNYKRSSEESNQDITDELKKILENDVFFENFELVLKSNSVKNYLDNKRLFNNNSVEFVSDDNYDDDLSKEYELLLENMNKDKNYLKKLIIYKYLPKYKRAFVNPLMRIIVNPLFIELSNSLKNDYQKTKEILTAYINIILIHEVIHLLKFFKKTFSFKNIPQTPKNKEGGEIFIKYLFGLSKINNIGYEQAKMINDLNNWNSILNLHKIFEINNGKNIKNFKEKQYNQIEYYIKFYDTDIEEDENSLNNEEEEQQDNWYDF